MSETEISRDQLAETYFEQLPFEPYPVQEEALLAWFTSSQGVLVCAPTGTGKTLIAEGALYEALRTGAKAYYTTPLIALTEQKFQEIQAAARRWGFDENEIGLVTGNRRVNPQARVLVVVAEILLNRLLHPEAFDFQEVAAVVMDEFHCFNDPERGIVWELSLGLLPKHVRLLLLSATVGNAMEFSTWLNREHQRRLELVQGEHRTVPLSYQWVGDRTLNEHIEDMARGDEEARRTPALVFCFNREECWNIAEQLKGKALQAKQRQAQILEAIAPYSWSGGAAPKLKQLLLRGVGVHHAGLLPKYRRIVEELFQKKLLSVAICTETLAAGINLPARSVVLPSIIKGPPGKKKIMDPSSAQQIFGRAGRPQFDTQGYVFVLAHEDDVKMLRWREKYDQIPEDTKDPGLRKAKKALKKKMPKRRANQQYWTEQQFEKLHAAPPGKLASRGLPPWRLVAHMLTVSPEVDRLRRLIDQRLMIGKPLEENKQALEKMLLVLWRAGYVTLEPEPPKSAPEPAETQSEPDAPPSAVQLFFAEQQAAKEKQAAKETSTKKTSAKETSAKETSSSPAKAAAEKATPADAQSSYRPKFAHPTPELAKLALLRSVNPLYGLFLVNQMGGADHKERIQAFESVLELPPSVGWQLRVPSQEELPPGPLATERIDHQLLTLGLVSAEELTAAPKEEQDRNWGAFDEPPPRVLTIAEKLRILFDYEFPGVHGVRTQSVWAAGELLEFGGDFSNFIASKRLHKQEGIVFRHLLRMILLLAEFEQLCPPDMAPADWKTYLRGLSDQLSESCRTVDPSSTDKALEQAQTLADSANSEEEISPKQ